MTGDDNVDVFSPFCLWTDDLHREGRHGWKGNGEGYVCLGRKKKNFE